LLLPWGTRGWGGGRAAPPRAVSATTGH
jgi:hypothetical protein